MLTTFDVVVNMSQYKFPPVEPCRAAPLSNGAKAADDRINAPTDLGENDVAAKTCTKNFTLEHLRGDLFACAPGVSLAHCISADIRMGKGIAVAFKQKFGGMPELKAQGKQPGQVAVLRRDNRFVYYLVTKPCYFNKPTYDSLRNSLQAMKQHAVSNGVTRLALPRIGCGLDGLQWDQVERIISDIFVDANMAITVYTL